MNQYKLYEDFFQQSNSYYLEQLDHYQNGRKYRFNYTALLFGIFWFLYRKMYLEFFIIFIILQIEAYVENAILVNLIGTEQTKLVKLLVTISFLIILGIIGNNLYLRKANRIVQKAEESFNDYEEQKRFLQRKGGTSYVYVTVLIILLILALVLGDKNVA